MYVVNKKWIFYSSLRGMEICVYVTNESHPSTGRPGLVPYLQLRPQSGVQRRSRLICLDVFQGLLLRPTATKPFRCICPQTVEVTAVKNLPLVTLGWVAAFSRGVPLRVLSLSVPPSFIFLREAC